MSLFDEMEDNTYNQFNILPLDDWNIIEKLDKEKELLGFYISGHPIDVYKQEIKRSVIVDLSDHKKNSFRKTYEYSCNDKYPKSNFNFEKTTRDGFYYNK